MAANAGAIRAGRAFVEAFLDDKKLVRGLRSVQKRLTDFGKQIAGIGAAITGLGTAASAPFIAATKVFTEAGSALNDMRARTGVSIEALSELGYAAGQTGTSTEALEAGLRGMSRTLIDAANGGKGTLSMLKSLGLSFEDLKGLSPEEQFTILGDAISKISDPTKRAAVAMDVFGKSGVALLPMFENGSKGLKEMRQRARELGLVMSTEDAEAADTLGDRLDDLWGQFKRIMQVVGASLAPMLTKLANTLITVSTQVIEWIDNNRAMVVLAAQIAAGVLAAGTAITAIGVALVGAGAAAGALATLFSTILSPLALVTAGVVGLGVWFAKSSGVISAAIDYLGGVFGSLKDTALGAFDAIKTAIEAGDIKAAANVLWAFLKLQWAEGTDVLLTAWEDLGFDMAEAWIKTCALLENTWKGFIANAQEFGNGLMEGLGIKKMGAEVDKKAFEKAAIRGDKEGMKNAIKVGPQPAFGNPNREQLQKDIDKRAEAAQAELNALKQARGERGGPGSDAARRAEDLRKAQEELRKSIGAAKGLAPKAGAGPGGMSPEMQALLDRLEGGGKAADLQSKAVSGGTFSGEAARMISGGVNPELDELKKISKNTSKLNKPNWLAYG